MADNNLVTQDQAQSQQGQQNATQLLSYDRLLKPEQIPGLPISDDQKKRFGPGVTSLWNTLKSKPRDDPGHREALQKLSQLTHSVINQVKQNGLQKARQQQQQQVQQQQQQQQSQAAEQKPQAQPMQRPPSQGQLPTNGQMNPNASNQQAGAAQGQATNEIPERIRQMVERATWLAPPGSENPQQYKDGVKKRYAEAAWRKEQAQNTMTPLQARIQQMRSQGLDIPQGMAQQLQKYQEAFSNANKFLQELNNQQGTFRSQQQTAASQQQARNASGPLMNGGAQNLNQQQPNGMQSGQQSQSQQQQAQQRQVPPNAAVEAMRQQQMNRQPSAGSPAAANNQAPNSATGPQQPQQFTRPPQTAQNSAGPFSQQSPQSAMQPGAQQGAQAFTQQGAIDAASRSYSNAGVSQSAGGQTTTQQFSTPNADKPTASSRWPMSKNFNPQPPSAVPMGSTRPTMAGPNNGPMGAMGQPAVQQTPSYNLHGPGDHVLDKKKLDELVRQVCGAGDGASAQSLHPEVEESILELADEFFDNVVTSACKLAKLRGSNMLDIRDLQLILQRQYNIRIPGYSTDEVRTVRKVQPTASYFQKVNAIQAAKVMGGKGDL